MIQITLTPALQYLSLTVLIVVSILVVLLVIGKERKP